MSTCLQAASRTLCGYSTCLTPRLLHGKVHSSSRSSGTPACIRFGRDCACTDGNILFPFLPFRPCPSAFLLFHQCCPPQGPLIATLPSLRKSDGTFSRGVQLWKSGWFPLIASPSIPNPIPPSGCQQICPLRSLTAVVDRCLFIFHSRHGSVPCNPSQRSWFSPLQHLTAVVVRSLAVPHIGRGSVPCNPSQRSWIGPLSSLARWRQNACLSHIKQRCLHLIAQLQKTR